MIFKCPICGHEEECIHYKIVMKGNVTIYKRKDNTFITCVDHSEQHLVAQVPDGELNVNFHSIMGKSLEEKKKYFKKRSHDHFMKHGNEYRKYCLMNNKE